MKRLKSLSALALLGVVASIAMQPAQAADQRGRYVVAFKPGAMGNGRAAVAAAGGRELLDVSEANAFAVDLPLRAVTALQANPNVAYVEEDVLRYPSALTEPSGPPYLPGQLVPYGIKMVQADQMPFQDAYTGNRTVCIIDSGYDLAHEDLHGNRVSGENLSDSGDWFTDEVHHGTHVAGTIAAMNNTGVGVVGVNPNSLLNIRIEKVFGSVGSASSSVIAKAMFRCGAKGANVVSMSLGGSSATHIEQAAAQALAAQGVLTIAAAGNAGDSSISYPAGFDTVMSVAAVDVNKQHAAFSQFNNTVEISAPGVQVLSTVPMGTGRDSSVSVAGNPVASNPMDGSPVGTATAPLYDYGLGDHSDPGVAGKVCLISRGAISFAAKVTQCQADGGVAAIVYNSTSGALLGTLGTTVTAIPSVGITKADGLALKAQVGTPATVSVLATNYAYFNGTSMATPHVSAVAALVWSYFPECSAQQIRASLDKSAQDLSGGAGWSAQYGYGLVQAKSAYDRIKSMGCGN